MKCNLVYVKDNKKNGRELGSVATEIRATFQGLLKSHIKNKTDLDSLARDLGVSVSLIKKMLYDGEGGLDIWAKAFAHIYGISNSDIHLLRNELRRKKPISESDKIWFSIKEEFGASEDDLHFLAACAREAYRIKIELEALKKKARK